MAGFGFDPNMDWRAFAGTALQDLGYGLATSPTVGTAFGGATRRAAEMQPYRDAQAEQRRVRDETAQENNSTRSWLKLHYPQYADLPVAEGWQAAMGDMAAKRNASTGQALPASIQEYNFYAQQTQASGGQPKPYDEWRQGSNQTIRAGLGQPVVLRRKGTTESTPFMPMSDGTYMNPLTQEVADDSYEFDPAYNAAQRAQGSAVGTAVGGVQFNLPAAKQNVDTELANIDAILADKEGLSQTFGNAGGVSINGVGLPNQWLPTLPNTPKANLAERVKQVVGQNFLQAFSSLKGAGAITEVEGSKAQDAMARLGSAQDQRSFETALNDLKTVLKIGYDRMSQQAGMMPSVGGQPPTGVTVDYKTEYGLE